MATKRKPTIKSKRTAQSKEANEKITLNDEVGTQLSGRPIWGVTVETNPQRPFDDTLALCAAQLTVEMSRRNPDKNILVLFWETVESLKKHELS